MRLTVTYTLIALIISVYTVEIVIISSNADLFSSANQYGIQCSISNEYTITTSTQFPNFITANFALSDLSLEEIFKAIVWINPTGCTGGSLTKIQVSSYSSGYSLDANDIVDKST